MHIGAAGQPGTGGVGQVNKGGMAGPTQAGKTDSAGLVQPGEQGQIPARDDLKPNSFSKLLYRPQPIKSAEKSAGPGPLRKMLDQSIKSERRLDHYLRRAMRGHVSDPNQLLALQMQVYRYTQQVEVLSRMVDRSTSSIKQVLQTRL